MGGNNNYRAQKKPKSAKKKKGFADL